VYESKIKSLLLNDKNVHIFDSDIFLLSDGELTLTAVVGEDDQEWVYDNEEFDSIIILHDGTEIPVKLSWAVYSTGEIPEIDLSGHVEDVRDYPMLEVIHTDENHDALAERLSKFSHNVTLKEIRKVKPRYVKMDITDINLLVEHAEWLEKQKGVNRIVEQAITEYIKNQKI
jgi:hypothetical protein